MHILALILMFVFGSIVAACDGDFSGLAAIGKFVGGAVLILQCYGYLHNRHY